jgi:hypothetical protein
MREVVESQGVMLESAALLFRVTSLAYREAGRRSGLAAVQQKIDHEKQAEGATQFAELPIGVQRLFRFLSLLTNNNA